MKKHLENLHGIVLIAICIGHVVLIPMLFISCSNKEDKKQEFKDSNFPMIVSDVHRSDACKHQSNSCADGGKYHVRGKKLDESDTWFSSNALFQIGDTLAVGVNAGPIRIDTAATISIPLSKTTW